MGRPLISLIVAMARNGVIGADGKLPWRIPEDMRWYRQNTLGKSVIMGRKTWESLPKRPLPDRTNIVVTSNASYDAPGAILASGFDEAVLKAGDVPEVVAIGGTAIYAAALPVAGRLYLTDVDAEPAGDTYMPHFDRTAWRVTFERVFPALGDANPGFALRILERIS